MISYEDVQELALRFPQTLEKESYGGQPSWRSTQRMYAWIRLDPEALVVWVESLEEKLALIEAEPTKFFTTDHYDGQPIVLVNLDAIERNEAGELLEESWRLRGPKKLVKAWDAETRPSPAD